MSTKLILESISQKVVGLEDEYRTAMFLYFRYGLKDYMKDNDNENDTHFMTSESDQDGTPAQFRQPPETPEG